MSELNNVIDAYKSNFFGEVQNRKIALIGHSSGGALSILAAGKRNDISCLITLAAVSKFERFIKRQKEDWKRKGYMEVLESHTNKMLRLNYTLVEDFERHQFDLLNIKKNVRRIKIPLLIIHGEQDLTVSINEGEQLFNWSDKNISEFFTIPNCGHKLNVEHPFITNNPKLDQAIDKSISFFRYHLI